MENLNAEQIVKALECFHERILNTNLAEKITEAEIMAIIDALSLINELTEENERLREKADRHLENLKAVLNERNESTIRADTVQKYKSAIIEYYSKPKYQPTKEHPIKHTQIECLFAVLDQIAKEMLEGE